MTDFGTQDVYVGVLKGVLASLSPQARLIDLTHQVPRGQVAAGAFMLWQAAPHLPAGTVFLAVVDPGVGTDRRGVAAIWPQKTFVGPDNGLISYWLEDQAPAFIYQLQLGVEPASQTFHGRDIFAPAAALLANGTPASDLGPMIDNPVRLVRPHLTIGPDGLVEGELLYRDGFGNWVTSIGLLARHPSGMRLSPWLGGEPVELPGARWLVRLPEGQPLELRRTFSDVEAGHGLAYIGSSGLVEIGVNQGAADQLYPLQIGQRIQLIAKE